MEAVCLQTALFKETLSPFFSYFPSICPFLPSFLSSFFLGFLDLPEKASPPCGPTASSKAQLLPYHSPHSCGHSFSQSIPWHACMEGSFKVKVLPSLPADVVEGSIQEAYSYVSLQQTWGRREDGNCKPDPALGLQYQKPGKRCVCFILQKHKEEPFMQIPLIRTPNNYSVELQDSLACFRGRFLLSLPYPWHPHIPFLCC